MSLTATDDVRSFSRRDALRTSALALGAIVLPRPPSSAATGEAKAPAVASGPPPITTVLLGGDLRLVTSGGGNIIVLGGTNGSIVIDSGLADQAAGNAGEIAKAGPLSILVNTHWHFDHTGGNERLAHVGARIMGHENCRVRLATDQIMEAFDRKIPAAPALARPLITFTAETALHLNGDDIRLIPVPPAHTDSDVFVRFEKANLLHAGDLFFQGMYPFIDYSSGGWIGGLVAAAKTLLAMTDAKTRIIPGHGPLATQDNLRMYHAFLEKLHEQLSEFKMAGRTVDEVIAAAPTKEFDEKFGKGFLKPEQFVRIAYTSLLRRQ